ncbi:MAG: hypothetical protein COY22_01245 [Candidatus Tagabacteria bacterium CG_4_10_14_0_2_um_filter_40_13]|uniref:Transglycosylase SLT domain-containing protein n=2 Tax=Candidatus Tagaibacteriota TaxID=1817918 RepID=A0A2M8G9A6_9BACT|nr:MAG: hypothetical protein COS58_01025 [Candidatus Tagabacteria bacterium CG03_land_8_20_14_0_80_41_22]PIZ56421.1 MAG: hypothetical protein COY22_01245 [Candidatus Tagabacteria bacterium CG_4_10_14_0_2_um_filter_40_13]PJC70033.1 MAG: hypothetical protein CO014_00775 [Candidatus Tagabacteria bacterium CG_4_8_14_3_um_filter_41_8]
MKKIKLFIFLSVIATMAPLIAFAAIGVTYPLVPCGGASQPACSVACFYVMIDRIINFILYAIAMPLSATALMVAGIYLVAGGSEKAITTGKAIFKFTLIGLFIAFGAWLIVDLILGNLLQDKYKFWQKFPAGCTANPVSSSLNNQITSNGLALNNSNTSTAVSNILDDGSYEDGVDTNTPGFQILENQPPEGTGLSPDINPTADCNANIPGNLLGADLNGVEPARVAAIIQAESSGNPNAFNAENDGKGSYGLMQVRADTARLYDSSLAGLSDAQIGDKLINDSKYNVNIGTKYYADLLNKYGNPTLASSAYNGGPLANRPSVNCANEPSPYGGTMRRWECPYDNNAHTVANIGYQPTRKYTQNINNFYQKNCSN